jgi:hypothetical protein
MTDHDASLLSVVALCREACVSHVRLGWAAVWGLERLLFLRAMPLRPGPCFSSGSPTHRAHLELPR